MRIVRIIARLNVGGPARHVVWLTAGLSKAEFDTMLVAGTVPSGEEDMSYFAAKNGVEPIVIPEMSRELSLGDVVTIWKLNRLLVRHKPDIIHTHTAKAGAVGRIAGWMYRWLTPASLIGRPRPCRFVHTYHGHIFHSYYGELRTTLFLWIERLLARLATDRITVVSNKQLEEIHEKFRVGKRSQFAIVPLGLDLSEFENSRDRRGVLRAELNADADEMLVGIVGRLTEIKNHKFFLETVAEFKNHLSSGLPRVRFVIVGDGHLRKVLEEQARSAGIESEVIFLGNRKDPRNFYPGFDIVALTSLNEGTPLTLLEAMANSRAIVASAVGGVVDLLGAEIERHNDYSVCERGILVKKHDAASFANAIAYMIAEQDLREATGARGRLFVEENHSLDRLVTDVENLYRDLLEAKGAALSRSKSRVTVSSQNRA